ncbi:ATP-binding protein [Streptantibioticus rubrisoli]|uniref:ATP-binding protein n=1 Tax=Streptantibioticus rubrisoli TaxID=1387313 RepID=A0ABT1P948_9ACTN|nr:ATP-binding protein [Streptantibioticus rubrisoli]MCQ4041904.1 ATP-binding protein [Streptantibioticus rubrisoli]
MINTQHSLRCAVRLEALPHRIGQVRRIVSAQLRYWELEQLLDTTLLGITELLANVHRHAQPDKQCTVELSYDRGRLTVSVTDNDPRPPSIALGTDALDTSGRGLAMLAALSDGWGTRPNADGDGKVVWFTLARRTPTVAPLHTSAPVRPATVMLGKRGLPVAASLA